MLLLINGSLEKQNYWGDCRLQDIENIIGGDTYTVDSIVVRSIVTFEGKPIGGTDQDKKNPVDEIWVGGRLTHIESQESKGFVYIFRPNDCSSYEFYEFDGINQGIREILRNFYYIFLVGYHIDENGNVYEQLLIMANRDKYDMTMEQTGTVLDWSKCDYVGDPYCHPRVIGMRLDDPEKKWNCNQAIPNGIFAFDADSPRILIVSAHEIRIYFLFWHVTDTYSMMLRTNVAADISFKHFAWQSREEAWVFYDIINLRTEMKYENTFSFGFWRAGSEMTDLTLN